MWHCQVGRCSDRLRRVTYHARCAKHRATLGESHLCVVQFHDDDGRLMCMVHGDLFLEEGQWSVVPPVVAPPPANGSIAQRQMCLSVVLPTSRTTNSGVMLRIGHLPARHCFMLQATITCQSHAAVDAVETECVRKVPNGIRHNRNNFPCSLLSEASNLGTIPGDTPDGWSRVACCTLHARGAEW